VFYLPVDKLIFTTAAEHAIPTPAIDSTRGINSKSYRIPEVNRKEVRRQTDQMLRDGIIEPSTSPWNSPIFAIPKKEDASGKKKRRIVVDFRKLNEVTVGDSFPLPVISEILDRLGNYKYFSIIDCASGFLQVPVRSEDQAKTAFSTREGHFQYKRMPFGLKGAPATFQRLMTTVLSGIPGIKCLVYLDDVVVFGENLSMHNETLRGVFSRMRKHNLKLQPDKCEFLRREISYLGHVIGQAGVKPDEKRVKAVRDYPEPRTTRELKGFLGLAGYYRKFIPNFSKIAKPLTELLKKDVPYTWNEKIETAFVTLKSLLTTEPLLQYPDFTRLFVLTTDASNAAIVWGCKYFRQYLYGGKLSIQVVTDHRPLTWIFSVKDPSSRLLRWRLKLEEYEYEVKYKKGSSNTNADALSRIHVTENCTDGQDDKSELNREEKLAIFREMHDSPLGGHLGMNRTYERMKLFITWPGMNKN